MVNQKHRIELDEDFMDELFHELEMRQDGDLGHEVVMNAESAQEAAENLLSRFVPFFADKFYDGKTMA